jgi:hypothetical protein
MPQFTACNGLEAKAIILDKISKALDETGDFSQNITYPWWKFNFSIRMTSYPKFALEAEPKEIAKGVEVPEEAPPDGEDLQVAGIVSEDIIVDTPDQDRVDADLPLPTAVPVKNVGIVDKPIAQAPQAKSKTQAKIHKALTEAK